MNGLEEGDSEEGGGRRSRKGLTVKSSISLSEGVGAEGISAKVCRYELVRLGTGCL